MKEFFRNLKYIQSKEYKEKWLGKTILIVLFSLVNMIITALLSIYVTADFSATKNIICETLKTGSLFIISISLLTNIANKKQNIAPENKALIDIILMLTLLLGIIIALLYGVSYKRDTNKLELERYQVIWSFICYILTILLIGCFNFLNRTDDIKEAVTEGEEKGIISVSESRKSDEGGMQLWLILNIF